MRSISYHILEAAVRCTGYKRIFNLDAEKLRAYIERTKQKRKTNPPGYIKRNFLVQEFTVDGRPCHVYGSKFFPLAGSFKIDKTPGGIALAARLPAGPGHFFSGCNENALVGLRENAGKVFT
jgi:hypothetical protein